MMKLPQLSSDLFDISSSMCNLVKRYEPDSESEAVICAAMSFHRVTANSLLSLVMELARAFGSLSWDYLLKVNIVFILSSRLSNDSCW